MYHLCARAAIKLHQKSSIYNIIECFRVFIYISQLYSCIFGNFFLLSPQNLPKLLFITVCTFSVFNQQQRRLRRILAQILNIIKNITERTTFFGKFFSNDQDHLQKYQTRHISPLFLYQALQVKGLVKENGKDELRDGEGMRGDWKQREYKWKLGKASIID